MKINVLGTEYTVTFKKDEDVCAEVSLSIGECGGYCSCTKKEIVIGNLDSSDEPEAEKAELKRQVLRHEIVHAFLNESGLADNSNFAGCWAKNEEMVDWFAIQGPKIYKAWKEAGAVD